MKKKVVFLIVVLVLLASCAAGPNELLDTAREGEEAAGFFKGLWHGFIMLFSFIVSLFNKNVSIYEVHNTGALYHLGYLIGASAFFGGSTGTGCKMNRK